MPSRRRFPFAEIADRDIRRYIPTKTKGEYTLILFIVLILERAIAIRHSDITPKSSDSIMLLSSENQP